MNKEETFKCAVCTADFCECEETEWIDAKSRLPKKPGFYLVCSKIFPVEKAEFDGKSRWNYPFDEVEYWMHLPRKPHSHE